MCVLRLTPTAGNGNGCKGGPKEQKVCGACGELICPPACRTARLLCT